MARWLSRDDRARISAGVGVWFSPGKWSLNDRIIGVAAAGLAVSVFLPWYRAFIEFPNGSSNGFLINPPGTASGITVHVFLWALFGLGLLQFGVLVARYARRGVRPRTVPAYGPFLLVTSAISLALALTAFMMKPRTWYGNSDLGGAFNINVGWDYGAIVAIIATIAILVVAWTMIRDPATR